MVMTASDIALQTGSDQIGKTPLHLPEPGDAKPEKEGGDAGADEKAWPVELGLAPQKAPAETVDDGDHRIERIEQAPLRGHDAGAEADRRDIEAELHQERDHEAKIPEFDVERRDPERRTKARQAAEQHEQRQEDNLPAGQEAI